MVLIEDMLNREDTKDEFEQYKINVKINRYGGIEDNRAFKMIKELKENNINISKHIRMLLALEYTGEIVFGSKERVSFGIDNEIATENIIEDEEAQSEDVFG